MNCEAGCELISSYQIFTDMSNQDNLNVEYVKRILKTLEPDLAALVVCSGVSLDPNVLLKMLIVATDISYYRNMKRDMEKTAPGNKNELTASEIANLLEGDGWIL